MQEKFLQLQEELKLAKAEKAETEAKNESLNEQLSSASEGYELSSARLETLEKMVEELRGALSHESEDKQLVNDNDVVEEEESSLDNLFDMEEEDLIIDEPEELPDTFDEDTPDIKDRMVQKALRFIKQGLTPNHIIKEKRWRPINTYTRLTKLVELGYYDARKFIDDKTYDVIMESIKVLGSKADANKLQDNCSKRVSLWQVKMILAELKFNKKVIPAQKKKVNDWFFIKGLVYSKNKTSKWFFEKKYNHKCRVVRSAAGYYLQLGEEFIKLGNYDSAIRYYDEGSIWVKSDYGNKLGHPLVHAIGKMTYLIGHIRDSKQKIVFTTPEGEEKTIIF